jgi:hypothetical protein
MWGEEGAVAWAELWEQIGPLAKQVMEGSTIFKHDGAYSLTLGSIARAG